MAINKTIQHKRSSVAGNVPSTAQVAVGELGINFADKSIYTQDGGGNIIELERDVFKSVTAPAAPASGDIWYDTTTGFLKLWDANQGAWIPLVNNGPTVLPGNTTSAVGFASGTGISGDPYLYTSNATVNTGNNAYVDTITVTGLQPGQVVDIKDTNSIANGGRFSISNNVADASGTLIFIISFNDQPSSATGTAFTAAYQIGTASAYVTAVVDIVAAAFPNAVNPPVDVDATTTTWTAANDTLTPGGCIEISLDGISWTAAPGTLAITSGDTLYTKWSGAAGSGTCIDSPDGSTITGTITASGGGIQNLSLVIDKAPDAFTFTDVTGVALTTVQASNTITVAGTNSYSYLTSSDTMEVSINNGAWTAVPASGTSVSVVKGDTVQVRHTSSSTASTAVDTTLDIGGVTDTFSSTTSAATPAVTTPTITAPISGATGIDNFATFSSSAYASTGGAGTHQDTDWELYASDGTTLLASSYNDTSNLESWSPLYEMTSGTQYNVRVKHRSNDPIDSAWSSLVNFTVQTGSLVKTDFDFIDAFQTTYNHTVNVDYVAGQTLVLFFASEHRGAGTVSSVSSITVDGNPATIDQTSNVPSAQGGNDAIAVMASYTPPTAVAATTATNISITYNVSAKRSLVSVYVIAQNMSLFDSQSAFGAGAAATNISTTHATVPAGSIVLAATAIPDGGIASTMTGVVRDTAITSVNGSSLSSGKQYQNTASTNYNVTSVQTGGNVGDGVAVISAIYTN